MIKRYRWFILFGISVVALMAWDKQSRLPLNERVISKAASLVPALRGLASQPTTGKPVPSQATPAPIKLADFEWKEKLEDNIRELSDNQDTQITIVHERSMNWNDQGQIIPAEAVKVMVKGEKKSTNFRALVDANSGRIIQTWDQPVYDPVNPREGFGIKLDPRYDN